MKRGENTNEKLNPYQLLGLDCKDRATIKDIRTIYFALTEIQKDAVNSTSSVIKKKRAEKRLAEIRWASNLLLDENNKKAYNQNSVIYKDEKRAWRKKRNPPFILKIARTNIGADVSDEANGAN